MKRLRLYQINQTSEGVVSYNYKNELFNVSIEVKKNEIQNVECETLSLTAPRLTVSFINGVWKCFSKHYAFDKVDHLIDLQGYMHEVALADFTAYDLSEILNSYEEEQALRAREVNVMKTRWDFMMKNLINSMITEG